ncbi:hypothetical protein PPIS_b0198 [Pseudoalteromonas piscicida]|uniref:Uncharacterized protein n=1 Tax=Pseudoalteromonas piscicida TaxID=43662 RepID=A0ABN5CIT7_PSEO7|nr:hypothetical protein PPIS_b0198 [Pseudoalteromonas piscicida]
MLGAFRARRCVVGFWAVVLMMALLAFSLVFKKKKGTTKCQN